MRRVLVLILLCWATRVRADCLTGFRPPVRYPSSADQSILVRDLDGDGAPDVIVSGNHVDQAGAFPVFANRGDGTFAPERLVPAAFGEELEDAADLDSDGLPDLVASKYWGNGIAIYRGLGDFSFAAGTPYGTATHGGPSRFADYDRDGSPDLISLSFGSGNPVRVHVFHGTGTVTLAPKTTFETMLANGVAPSLRERDGALEILIGERSGRLAILRYANGTLSTSALPIGSDFDLTSTFADIDGDGIDDVVYTTESGTVFVMIANRDGTFGEPRRITSFTKPEFPVNLVVSDFDRDGRADVVVSDFRMPTLYFLRGKGGGDFEDARTIDAAGPVNTFAAADLNRDGYPDLVTANDDDTLSVLIHAGPCAIRRRAARP